MRDLAINRIQNILSPGTHFDEGRYQTVIEYLCSLVLMPVPSRKKFNIVSFLATYPWKDLSDAQVLNVFSLATARFFVQR